MSTAQDGAMVILSSPSGAGKTTLVKKISSQRKNFEISISYTTRIPRLSEKNGKDYFFINQKEFEKLILKDELLEHAEVFDNLYGTSKIKVIETLKKGNNVIFDIDWQGANQIKEKKLNYKLISIFILPPSKKTLLGRLSERENNNKQFIEGRMKQFEKDVLHWRNYDYVVINDNLEICLNEILKVIDMFTEDKSIGFDNHKIENHVNKLII
ncbi:MAG: guanylate kinase [Rickettsiales bacterium TMED289]|nr:MAG: guanylate kinase [Rickettsiales bacterium TMED289]|tara:strand:- start:847 stop:1482 length:636 start_codon:yes stop_codon:yes gene_type:complete